MTLGKTISALLAVALLATACTNSADTGDSTMPSPSTTSAPETTSTTSSDDSTTTTASSLEREIDLVGCDDADEDIAIVCEAYDLVLEHYVDDVDVADLADAAVLGLELLDGADSDGLLVCATPADVFASTCEVAARAADDSVEAAEAMVAGMITYGLDPNSAYLDPQALDLLQDDQDGQIEGIGALVSPEDHTLPEENRQCGVISETCRIRIVSTISGAPAEDAGLTADDVIVAVDGTSILGWTIDEVTAAVRGPAGSDVTLTIERGGEKIEVTITRASVQVPTVDSETIDDVGYVSLANFTGNASSQFEEAIVDRLSDGVDRLVIDFRNNPGGFLTTAIDVTSVFLDEGDVVVTEGPGESTSYPVNGNSIVPEDVDVFIVVNAGSASASEVVAAAIQEAGRALVVGESTFGKNTVQQRFGISNGGALKLTIARWLTPNGQDFGGAGVTPDVELDVNGLTADELVDAIAEMG
ncbi:MAG TPA: S41 family peptidase [Acidimicrobiia bacterium]|nr:S41 family peptidase [Acidimicrobiia bacterium]